MFFVGEEKANRGERDNSSFEQILAHFLDGRYLIS